MARFYVGQRVRIVGCEDKIGEKQIGREATVNELACMNMARESGYIGVTIDSIDDWCFLPEHLEPILDDGRQLSTWSECAWQPPHLREVKA